MRLHVVFVALGIAGCSASTSPSDEASAAAMLSSDAIADTSCRIILTEADTVAGVHSHCTLSGTVDVAASVSNVKKVGVAYDTGNGSGWTDADAEPTTGAPSGFTRYQFSADHVCNPIGFVPWVSTDAGKIFDHNRNAGNYVAQEAYHPGNTCAAPPQSGADKACRVILNGAQSAPSATSGAGWCTLTGAVDVADSVKSVISAGVSLDETGRGTWYDRAGEKVEGAAAGFTRYQFSAEYECSTSGVELIPWVTTDTGRLWDHNTTDGNYRLVDCPLGPPPVCR